MNVFQVISNLYTSKDITWIKEVPEEEIQPFIIQTFLVMNDNIRAEVRWLDKYVFSLPPKMYLSLAWSVLPKSDKAPFVKYIKKLEEEEEFNFILSLVRKHFNLSDNDYNSNKIRILKAIKSDMPAWFKYYGVPKKVWKQYYLSFDFMKEDENKKPENKNIGLGAWGL